MTTLGKDKEYSNSPPLSVWLVLGIRVIMDSIKMSYHRLHKLLHIIANYIKKSENKVYLSLSFKDRLELNRPREYSKLRKTA